MSGLDNMKQRLEIAGGNQDGRNVKGKLQSMLYSLWNSYQGEWITFNDKKWRCLINPEKLSEDYDQKEISIEFSSGMRPGDVFYWNRTQHYWIVYTAHEEEEAYFRARIRKCEYQIETDNDKYWVWLRGPAEQDTTWSKVHSIEVNELNYSLEMYITKNDDTLDFFSRHQQLKFDGHNWKVVATDKYSQKGIIEVYLKEDYDNTMADNIIEPEITKPDTESGNPYIEGPQEVNVYDTDLTYTIKNASAGAFVVNSSKVNITSSDSNSCTLDITTGKSTSFEVLYQVAGQSDVVLKVLVKSF